MTDTAQQTDQSEELVRRPQVASTARERSPADTLNALLEAQRETNSTLDSWREARQETSMVLDSLSSRVNLLSNQLDATNEMLARVHRRLWAQNVIAWVQIAGFILVVVFLLVVALDRLGVLVLPTLPGLP